MSLIEKIKEVTAAGYSVMFDDKTQFEKHSVTVSKNEKHCVYLFFPEQFIEEEIVEAIDYLIKRLNI